MLLNKYNSFQQGHNEFKLSPYTLFYQKWHVETVVALYDYYYLLSNSTESSIDYLNVFR